VLPGDAAGHLVAASRDAALVVVGRHRRRLLAPARMMGLVDGSRVDVPALLTLVREVRRDGQIRELDLDGCEIVGGH